MIKRNNHKENFLCKKKKKKSYKKIAIYLKYYRFYLLGAKELGINVLELQCVMLANHDQNV